MAHSTKRNNPEFTELDMVSNRSMSSARRQSNTSLLLAVVPSTAPEDAARNVASDDENRLTCWPDEIRRAVTVHDDVSQTDENNIRKERKPPKYPHSLHKEDVDVVIRRRKSEDDNRRCPPEDDDAIPRS